MDAWFHVYVAFLFAVAAFLFLLFLLILIWCCIRGRSPRKESTLHFTSPVSASAASLVLNTATVATSTNAASTVTTTSTTTLASVAARQQHSSTFSPANQKLVCVLPSPELPLNSITTVQPEEVIPCGLFEKPCVPFGTPFRALSGVHGVASGQASPILSSCTGSPVTACGSPIHTPPLRLRTKGLLERRGSNASLTLDLSATSVDSPIVGSPPRESTAEEYLQSASNPLSYKDLMLSLNNATGIHKEFWEIPMNHPDKTEVPGSGVKNRYRTILPNEITRVKLLQSNNDDPLTAYINANYIRGYKGEPCAYIATQGPMANTLTDFWKMVWQEKVPIIVMITKLQEQNSVKCESYLPESSGVYGDIEVVTEKLVEHGSYVVRHLRLRVSTFDVL